MADASTSSQAPADLEEQIGFLVADIAAVDAGAQAAARQRWDALAKPPGSLGIVEDVGVWLAGIAGTSPPQPPVQPAVVVAAADHGVHGRGLSSWPQPVTAAMVDVMGSGRAAVNAFAAAVGARVVILDVGLAGTVTDSPLLHRARVRDGTADLAAEAAMTRRQAAEAVLAGASLAEELVGAGVDLLALGEVGMANTTAAACLVAAVTGEGPAQVTGPGAGGDAALLARKREVIASALGRHRPRRDDPLGTLAAVGGLEHAALVGVVLSAAADAVPVLLDGVGAVAAAVVAAALAPVAGDYLLAGHRPPEPAATVGLDHLGLRPLLSLGLGLGEGTGALLAVPVVLAAARALADMASIAEVVPAADHTC